jgi:hypothetical protein
MQTLLLQCLYANELFLITENKDHLLRCPSSSYRTRPKKEPVFYNIKKDMDIQATWSSLEHVCLLHVLSLCIYIIPKRKTRESKDIILDRGFLVHCTTQTIVLFLYCILIKCAKSRKSG